MALVAVVTGASAGVGRAIVRELASRGARVALIARDEERLAAALKEVRDLGSDGISIACDVSDDAALENAAARIESELGPIDVWINNAMATVLAPAHEITPAEFRRVTDVTYLGVVYGTLAALRRMVLRDRGHIIQVGSALSYVGLPLQSAYCAAKHAMRGFTNTLRSELIHDRSHVFLTMAQLPAMNTPQFSWCRTRMNGHPQPLPPIFQPEVAARAIVDVIGHRRREIYVGWPTWKAILGQKLAPAFVERLLAKKAISSQRARELAFDPQRPDNLFVAVQGDYGAHGVFDEKARERSWQSALSRLWTHVRGLFEKMLSIAAPSSALPERG